MKVVNDLLIAKDSGFDSVLVLLDFSAAFDCLDHKLLISILQSRVGITGIPLSWLESYLKNRSQMVKVKNNYSDPMHIPSGVPQGSLLGPILFTLYLLPLYDLMDDLEINFHAYADDHQLYFTCTSAVLVQNKIEQVIAKLNSWFTSHFF